MDLEPLEALWGNPSPVEGPMPLLLQQIPASVMDLQKQMEDDLEEFKSVFPSSPMEIDIEFKEDMPNHQEDPVHIRMMHVYDDLPCPQLEPMTPPSSSAPSNNRCNLNKPLHKVADRLEKLELRRSRKNRERILQYQHREEIESALARWWRRMGVLYGVMLSSNDILDIEGDFIRDSGKRIDVCLAQFKVARGTSAYTYLNMHAEMYAKNMWNVWARMVTEAKYPSCKVKKERVCAAVLIAQEASISDCADSVMINYTNTRWCVDSGANRDICRDVSLAQGREISKALSIGEAGQSHSFMSEAEGPVDVSANGKILPLLDRTIFAQKIHENIMSVSEAVAKGYVMVFDDKGVYLFDKPLKWKRAPILKGKKDPGSRLFYFDFPLKAPLKCAHAAVMRTTEAKNGITEANFHYRSKNCASNGQCKASPTSLRGGGGGGFLNPSKLP